MSPWWNASTGMLPSMSGLSSGNDASCSSFERCGSSQSIVNCAMFWYHHATDSQTPLSTACCSVSAQCTSVYAATLFVETSLIGFASGLFQASRYALIWAAILSSGCMIENDSRPSWFWPATALEPSDVAAIQHGGCGSWNGLGVMSRFGNWNVGLSHSKYSSRHMAQTILIASS